MLPCLRALSRCLVGASPPLVSVLASVPTLRVVVSAPIPRPLSAVISCILRAACRWHGHGLLISSHVFYFRSDMSYLLAQNSCRGKKLTPPPMKKTNFCIFIILVLILESNNIQHIISYTVQRHEDTLIQRHQGSGAPSFSFSNFARFLV